MECVSFSTTSIKRLSFYSIPYSIGKVLLQKEYHKVIWLVEMHIRAGIIVYIPRKTKCIGKTVLGDKKLAGYWWRMINYLDLMVVKME